jgi:5-methylcytosine-specific restriction endonuclease McrA
MTESSTEFYHVTKPCKRGHAPIRYFRSRKCVECSKLHSIGWAKTNPEGHRLRGRRWFAAHRDAVVERQRSRRAADPEKVCEDQRRRRAANIEVERERERIKSVKRRARVACHENHTADDRALIFELQNGCCFYCSIELTYGSGKIHGDHFVPVSRGGSDARYNITMACERCNLQKGAALPSVFAARKGTDPNKRPVFWSERDD